MLKQRFKFGKCTFSTLKMKERLKKMFVSNLIAAMYFFVFKRHVEIKKDLCSLNQLLHP